MEQQWPSRTVLSVEHPGSVKSVERALITLGGQAAMRKMADDPLENSLELRLRPDDRFEHPVISSTQNTINLLIKVQRNKAGKTIISHEPVAKIMHSVRFRGIADFQWNMSKSNFANRLDQVLNCKDASIISQFAMSRDSEADTDEIDNMPPPIFSHVVASQDYSYQQNPAAKQVQTEAGTKLVNRTRATRQHLITRHPDDADVPSAHSPLLTQTLSTDMLHLIERLRVLFNERPIWTRRGILNSLTDPHDLLILRYAIPYTAYMWKAGPWRDCYVKFGLDPRSDPMYANYQAIYCTAKSMPPGASNSDVTRNTSKSHIFDGKTLFPEGRTYQFIDMIDPILVQIQAGARKREQPHPQFGWWTAHTIRSVRTIVRGKLASLCTGSIPSDVDFSSLLEQLNDVSNEEKHAQADIEDTEEEEQDEVPDDIEEVDDDDDDDDDGNDDQALDPLLKVSVHTP